MDSTNRPGDRRAILLSPGDIFKNEGPRMARSRLVKYSLCVGAVAGLIAYSAYIDAEVVFDGSLGTPGELTGPDFSVGEDRGRQVGNNLFHSFDRFSLNKGERATFTGRDSINNVISRVTGKDKSSINGELRSVIKSADFYLINPNGIIFGPDAVVDIDGLFHPGTSRSLEFSSGETYEARVDGGVPVLATARPTEYGFLGDGAGPIHLIGATLQNNSGISLSAEEIRLEDQSTVSTAASQFGVSGGAINLYAERGITLVGGSAIVSVTDSTDNAGTININVKDGDVTLIEGGGVISTTRAEGSAGDININADRVVIGGGTVVNSSTLDTGSGGGISIVADESVDISGRAEDDFGNTVYADSITGGDAGSIAIEAPRIRIGDQATISTRTWGSSGNGGNISLVANDRLEVTQGAGVRADTFWKGDGGSISLQAGELHLDDGASISSSSRASAVGANDPSGDAGKIIIETSGNFQLSNSRITSQAQQSSGGDIAIKVGKHFRLNNGEISTSVRKGDGAGGGVDIIADKALVLLGDSRITALGDVGFGGNISIDAGYTFISPKSTIDASANPAGIGGRVKINSRSLIDNNNERPLSTEFPDVMMLLQPRCSAGSGGSRFTAAPRRGLPLSPEGPLVAFEATGAGDSSAYTATTGAAPVAGVVDAVSARGSSGGKKKYQRTSAKDGYLSSDEIVRRGDALRALAQAQQSRGEFVESVQTLRGALVLAEQSKDPAEMASVLGGLGNALLAAGKPEAAEQFLTRAIVLSKHADQPDLAAGIMNNLGNQQAADEAFEKASSAYLESARLARESGDLVQETRAMSNAARVSLQLQKESQALELLDRAFQQAGKLADNQGTTVIAIHLGKSYADLAASSPEHREYAFLHAYQLLKRAVEISETNDDMYNLSYALGNLGALYQRESRYEEALYLTRRAMYTAEQAQAPESIYRWHWQEGQLLWAQGRADAAIAALRRAVAILEDTQQETLAQYGIASFHFRQAIAPVYLQLVKALLERATELGDDSKVQTLRIEARATVEQFKAAELRDYFRDECVADLEARTKNLEAISSTAAVVYPILLPEKLELLVSLSTGLEHYSVPVSAREIKQSVREFRVFLERRSDVRKVSRQLYEWLVRPYAKQLAEADIDTLVFVPDGLLRTIPLAALHDGEHFLINKYGVAITPGLALTDPRPLDRKGANPLLAGLSKSVQGFPALEHVPEELTAVHQEYGGRILLDEDFTLDQMRESFESKAPSIVHIASHGRFTGDPKSSFLLTYDGRLSMDRLNSYIGTAKYQEQPLELLVLSACETAAGDERAALGLAGVGVRAGARSALGSLWNISDEATARLVAEFYKQLKAPGLSKAQALQQAQLRLKNTPRFEHPFYWSPFLLINNWL